MHIYLKNNSAKFYPHLIWSDVALELKRLPQEEEEQEDKEEQGEYRYEISSSWSKRSVHDDMI